MAEADVDDDWPAAALAHDALVARVLLTLSATPAGRAAELRWGVTQPRSRPGRAEAPETKKEGAAAAAAVGGGRQGSPTTPLSWSDGTSPSGGNGGVDIAEADANRHLKRKHKAGAGLVNAATSGSRRSKKKKTIDELKAEENELLRTKFEIVQKLEFFKIKHKELQDTNDKLKSLMKQTSEDKVEVESNPASRKTLIEADFTLPDLNLPVESGSETPYGTKLTTNI